MPKYNNNRINKGVGTSADEDSEKVLGHLRTDDRSYRKKNNHELYLKIKKISDTVINRRDSLVTSTGWVKDD